MPDLAATPWADWARTAIAGDASARRYTRLTGPNGDSVILMETPASERASQAAFVGLADHLNAQGFCAPQRLWQDDTRLVISDLGKTDMAQTLSRHPDQSHPLYKAATDVLVALHTAPAPELARLTPEFAGVMVRLTATSYCNDADLADTLEKAITAAMSANAPKADRLALRDFHAENLIWRPLETGHDRLGLLDFQDAFIAPAGYDLASLLRDARRDVPQDIYDAMTARFCAATGQDPMFFGAQMACLGVQRNLRILGVFARLARDLKKPKYVALLPRVWRHLQSDLAHPALAELSVLITARIPDPATAQTRWAQ